MLSAYTVLGAPSDHVRKRSGSAICNLYTADTYLGTDEPLLEIRVDHP